MHDSNSEGASPPSETSPQGAVRAAGRRGAGAPPSEASNPEIRAAGRRGAGAPPSEASNPEIRAAGRRGAGAPPSEASNPEIRAAGRRGAGAPAVRGEQSGEIAPAKPALEHVYAITRAFLRRAARTRMTGRSAIGRGVAPGHPDGRLVLHALGLKKHFGGVQAVNGVDLAGAPGDLPAIIRPNGAGKTTLFHLLRRHLAHDPRRTS